MQAKIVEAVQNGTGVYVVIQTYVNAPHRLMVDSALMQPWPTNDLITQGVINTITFDQKNILCGQDGIQNCLQQFQMNIPLNVEICDVDGVYIFGYDVYHDPSNTIAECHPRANVTVDITMAGLCGAVEITAEAEASLRLMEDATFSTLLDPYVISLPELIYVQKEVLVSIPLYTMDIQQLGWRAGAAQSFTRLYDVNGGAGFNAAFWNAALGGAGHTMLAPTVDELDATILRQNFILTGEACEANCLFGTDLVFPGGSFEIASSSLLTYNARRRSLSLRDDAQRARAEDNDLDINANVAFWVQNGGNEDEEGEDETPVVVQTNNGEPAGDVYILIAIIAATFVLCCVCLCILIGFLIIVGRRRERENQQREYMKEYQKGGEMPRFSFEDPGLLASIANEKSEKAPPAFFQ